MTLTRQTIKMSRASHTYVYGESQNGNTDFDPEADICRGEPNCYGILTCFCFDREIPYFDGPASLMGMIEDYIMNDIRNVPTHLPVTVLAGLGKGKSQMDTKTPELYKYMIDGLHMHLKDCEVTWL